MSYFSWKEKYSVGVDILDNDHKILVDLIDQLHTAFVEKRVIERMDAILSSLKDYSNTHFIREEMLLEKHGYKELIKHKKSHAELKMQVIEILDKFKKNKDEKIGMELLSLLHDWLYFHILDEDMNYKDFFKDKEIG